MPLRYLALFACIQLTDQCMVHLRSAPLQYLNIQYIRTMTAAVFERLPQQCRVMATKGLLHAQCVRASGLAIPATTPVEIMTCSCLLQMH